MTELTIRRLAMSLIADATCYIADNNADERTIALSYVYGVITMTNELIATLETEGEEGVKG